MTASFALWPKCLLLSGRYLFGQPSVAFFAGGDSLRGFVVSGCLPKAALKRTR